MNTFKSSLVVLFLGFASFTIAQNAPIDITQGSNFKIAVAPTFGYINFSERTFGNNVDNALLGGQIAFYSERATLKKSYFRPQLNYMYHVKRLANPHDFVFNHFITFNPEYLFKAKKFEFGGGISLGITQQTMKFKEADFGLFEKPNRSFIYGASITGIYNFNRLFLSTSINYNIQAQFVRLAPKSSTLSTTQYLIRLGYKL